MPTDATTEVPAAASKNTRHLLGNISATATLAAAVKAGPTFRTTVDTVEMAAPVNIVYQESEAGLYPCMEGVIDPEVATLTSTMI